MSLLTRSLLRSILSQAPRGQRETKANAVLSSQETQRILDKIQTARRTEHFFSPTLDEIEAWFLNVVVPQRTSSAGMNLHRIYVGPRALFLGNTPKPNGLCGDAAKFVEQEFGDSFLAYTKSGEGLRRILWRSSPWNHVANLFVPRTILSFLNYGSRNNEVIALKGDASYSSVRNLKVLDLYYKQVYTVDTWWLQRGSTRKGTIEIGREHEIGD